MQSAWTALDEDVTFGMSIDRSEARSGERERERKARCSGLSQQPVFSDPMSGYSRPVVALRQAATTATEPSARAATHSYAVLSFCTGGEARVEQTGDWKIAPGDVLLIPAGTPHRLLETRRHEYWGLVCTPSYGSSARGRLLEPFERVRDGATAVVHVPAARHAFLETLFREFESLCRRAAQPQIEQSLLTLILSEVERAAGSAPAPRAARSSSVVTDSLRFIERNALRRLTLNEVARAVGRSPAYVTSALSRATGRSAVDWIVSARMAEARRMLLHSEQRVELIAERVGYADATHFIRMFRRLHGATPAAWRAAHAGELAK